MQHMLFGRAGNPPLFSHTVCLEISPAIQGMPQCAAGSQGAHVCVVKSDTSWQGSLL
jgi:hypothetical protein